MDFHAKKSMGIWTGLLALKAVATIIMINLTLNLPHVWRQVDTLGVSFRYWQRLTTSHDAHPFWAAVLNSGNFVGYIGMELPVINILTAPAFYFGTAAGVKLAACLLILVNIILWLIAVRVWEGIQVNGVPLAKALLWLPLVGITSLFFGRFIPDAPAMLCCLIGTGLIWKNPRSFGGLLFAVVGLLIKPQVFVIFALLLLRNGRIRNFSPNYAVIPSVATGTAALYVLRVIPLLDAIEANPRLFETSLRSPLPTFISFFENPMRTFSVIDQNMFFPGFLLMLVLLVLTSGKGFLFSSISSVLVVLSLQIVAVAVLVGDHALAHSYYLIGTAPVVVLLFYKIFSYPFESRIQKIFIRVVGVLFITNQVGAACFDMRSIIAPPQAERMPSLSECAALKSESPEVPWGQHLVFRTIDHKYPKLGLCFGERTGTEHAAFGFYLKSESIPVKCRVLKQGININIVTCPVQT